VAVQLSFHQIGEALSWNVDLDLGMLELASLMIISVKEAYALRLYWILRKPERDASFDQRGKKWPISL